MDDIYKINVAKTEFREAYDTGDVDRLLSVFNQDGFTDMSEGGPTKYGAEAIARLRNQASALFAAHSVKLSPIINRIIVLGDMAYDYGWHEFTFQPKNGGVANRKRQRYFELWKRNSDGSWRISLHINNADFREELNGYASRWFLSGEQLQESTR
jgi:ketosteroid isomerase-like protein